MTAPPMHVPETREEEMARALYDHSYGPGGWDRDSPTMPLTRRRYLGEAAFVLTRIEAAREEGREEGRSEARREMAAHTSQYYEDMDEMARAQVDAEDVSKLCKVLGNW